MKALTIDAFGGIDRLKLRDVAMPVVSRGEVLVKVAATALNPIDIKTRQGRGAANHAHVTLPMILGWDVSGTVIRCAPDVTEFQPGDQVFGSVGFPGLGQTHAEYAAIAACHLTHKPATVSHQQCAAVSMVGLTAWQALRPDEWLKTGDKILIWGASGGVGHIAVQIAAALNTDIYGTASAHKCDWIRTLGVDHVMDYHRTTWKQYPSDFDYILDTVGGTQTQKLLGLLKVGGTLVTLLPQRFDALVQRAQAQGKHARFVLMQSNHADMAQVAGLLQRGMIAAQIADVLALADAARGHVMLETHQAFGKIVLVP